MNPNHPDPGAQLDRSGSAERLTLADWLYWFEMCFWEDRNAREGEEVSVDQEQ